MPMLRNPGRRPARATSVVVLLVLALTLVGALTYQAQDAARSHRDAAEAALTDYAAFAAWEYARLASDELQWELWAFSRAVYYQPLAPCACPGALPSRAELAKLYGKIGQTESAYRPRFWFALDFESGMLHVSGPDLDPRFADWIRAEVTRHALAHYSPKMEQASLLSPVGGRRMITYTLKRDSLERPVAAYGYEMGLGLFQSVLRRVFDKAILLPPAVAGAARNDSLLSLAVTDGYGQPVLRSQPYFESRFLARDSLDVAVAGLAVNVSIRPDAADMLVIGGLPRSRMPLLLGLLALTVGLVVIALVQLRREYELAQVRQDFVSGVSHELRTPLAQIRMFCETLLLERVRSPEEGRRALDIINRESQRLTHLVENVLQFSRAERGTVQLSPEPTRLDELIHDLVESFQPLAAARDVTVAAALEPGVQATVDQEAMRQVLLNLLDNAVKYGPSGQTVRVGLALRNGAVEMSVQDEGPGIPPEAREQVWEPYWRLARDSESAVGGSGIGLAVVRELVTLHNGSVGVEDGPGRGARFVVRIPGATRAGLPAALPPEAAGVDA